MNQKGGLATGMGSY